MQGIGKRTLGLAARYVDRWTRWLGTERWTIAPSIARIAFGAIMIATYVVCFTNRELFFFGNGIDSTAMYRAAFEPTWGWNVFSISTNAVVDNVLYGASFLIAVLFTIGFMTRVTTVLFAGTTWMILHSSTSLMDGGYRLMCIVLVYLCFADMGRHFSVDAKFGRTRSPHFLSVACNNAAIVACILQLCVLYAFSAFYKMQGETWQQGIAVYYAINQSEFFVSPFSKAAISSPYAVALGTYATLVFQSAFPWLVINHRTRLVTLAVAIAFHVSIALTMGLQWFSAIMIVSEFLVPTDDDYRSLETLLARTRDFLAPKETPLDAAVPATADA